MQKRAIRVNAESGSPDGLNQSSVTIDTQIQPRMRRVRPLNLPNFAHGE
jgi:hypothetical protein